MKSNPELEAAIDASPDDVDAHLVYADWLQSVDEPLGELIVVQHQRECATTVDQLEQYTAAEHRFMEAHEGDLFGDVTLRPFGLRWRLGFVREAHFAVLDAGTAVETLERFLHAPATRYLRALGIEHRPYVNSDYAPLTDVLARHGSLDLRALSIGTDRNSGQLGSLDALCRALPRLEWLRLRGYSLTPSDFAWESLRGLEMRVRETTGEVVESLRNAAWPQLTSLTIDLRGGRVIPDDLETLFADEGHFPMLRHLALVSGAGLSNELCRVLAESSILGQLHTLDLSDGSLTQAGADVLADALREEAPELRLLNLAENSLDAPVDALDPLEVDVHYGIQNGAGRQNFGWKKPQKYASEYSGWDQPHPSTAPLRAELKRRIAAGKIIDAVALYDSLPAYSRHRWGDSGRQTLLTLLGSLSPDHHPATVIRLAREAPPCARSQSVYAYEVLSLILSGELDAADVAAEELLALLANSPHFSPRESLVRIFKKWMEGISGDESVIPSLERSLGWEPVAWRRFALASILRNSDPERAATLLTEAYTGSMSVTPTLPSVDSARKLFADAPTCLEALDGLDR